VDCAYAMNFSPASRVYGCGKASVRKPAIFLLLPQATKESKSETCQDLSLKGNLLSTATSILWKWNFLIISIQG